MSNLKRKMGRPPIAGETMEQISIRLTVSELKRVDAVSKKKDVSRNEAIRYLITKGLSRE